MSEEQVATLIGAFLHTDRAAIRLYDVAIPQLTDAIADALGQFRGDHERHIRELEETAKTPGWEPRDASEDLLELTSEHERLLAAASDEGAVLETLLLAERSVSALYDAAEIFDLEDEFADLITSHHADEGLHVAYLHERIPALAAVRSATPDPTRAMACLTSGFVDDRNPDDFE